MRAREAVIDWEGFGEYLELLGLSRKRRSDLLRYAKRYYRLLWASPVEAARVIAVESPHVAVKVLAALSRLAEHLGVEEDWARRRRAIRRLLRYRLRGALPRSRVPRYLREEPGFVERLLSIARRLPGNYRLFAAFMLATGLRSLEALHAYRGYHVYRVERWGVPHLLLSWDNGSKRAWLALLTPEIDSKLQTIDAHGVSYTRLRMQWKRACRELGLDHRVYRIYDLRTANATLLLEAGAPAWLVDGLQGRTGPEILMKHYNAAELPVIYRKWYLPALREPVRRLLE
ncbi:integrase [Pyrodictium delaneyi]|uniref:Tyr recombinase domain-containing protein n=1 Tax=Pyrodictium delaneyi TaxID=1273541 RepID=A0A211YRD5_9CREN|nr:integrase [Pyrodictium delaneyi]OWJ55579.1 hypothetical protein Pdsh_01985 [Pyrodictium delaneyi]